MICRSSSRAAARTADPHLVNAWIQEVTAARAAAQATLRTITSKPVLTHDDIALLVASIQDVMSAFRAANPRRKGRIYRQVGLKIAYNHVKRSIRLSASPSGSCTKLCPTGDTNQTPRGPQVCGVILLS